MAPERISHYELESVLGRGGMGVVYAATDLKLPRRVALKFLSPELAADPDALARFSREARAAAKLTHPHIATIYEFEPEGERPFIAMELLPGSSLKEWIQGGPLPVEEALVIARDVASALAYAHHHGVEHRDIKPENLMLDEHGRVKITDFGLARATMTTRLTATGASLGTPAYMAPEAIRGEPKAASDVFSLGLVLYELLSGQRAFPGEQVMVVMYAIANSEPEPIRTLRPEVPETVAALIARMLVKHPEQRIDAQTATAELAALTGGSPPPAPRPRFRLKPAVVAVAALAVIAAGALWDKGVRARKAEASRLDDLATAAIRKGDYDAARDLGLRALELDSKRTTALNNLGMVRLHEGAFAAAESLFQAALERSGNDPKFRAATLHNLADCDIGQKVYDRAVRRLSESFTLDSSSADAYNNLGWAMIQNGQSGDALAVLERGIGRFPAEKYLYKNAGLAARDLGDREQATRFLDEALRRDPGFEEAASLRREVAAPS
jgi:serine/threonine-protein kinase